MTLETYVQDAVVHFAVGIGAVFADYGVHKALYPEKKRIEDKTECLEAMTRILEADEINTTQYAKDIDIVGSYLRREGMLDMDVSPWQRAKDTFHYAGHREFFNELKMRGKLGVAATVAVVGDIGLLVTNFSVENIPYDSMLKSTYQIPALWLGFGAGTILRNMYSWVATSSSERELNHAIRNGANDKGIAQTVITYNPNDEVSEQLQKEGFVALYLGKAAESGRKLFGVARDIGGSAQDALAEVGSYPQRRRQEGEAKRQRRIKRWKVLTKRE